MEIFHPRVVLSPRFVKKGNIFNDKYKIASELDFFISVCKIKGLYVKSSKLKLLNLSPGGLSERKFVKNKEVLLFISNVLVYFYLSLLL